MLQNNTGHTLTSFTISYTGEVWGKSRGSARTELDFQYKVGATGIGDTTGFQEVNDNTGLTTPNPGGGDFVAPASVAEGPADGTATANQQVVNQTFNVAVPTGSSLALRFVTYKTASSSLTA